MKTFPLRLDDELDSALEAFCAEDGRDKVEVVREVVRNYVEKERMKRALEDPALAALYQELALEDVALAEGGMADYKRMLDSADRT